VRGFIGPLAVRDGTKGLQSRDELQARIAERVVGVRGALFDPYDRVVAIWRIEGRDIGQDMVAMG